MPDDIDRAIDNLRDLIHDKIHRRNLQIDDLRRTRYDERELRTMGWRYDRLTLKDLIAIRSALGQKIGQQYPDAYQDALDHLNLMYTRRQSAEDAEVTGNA